MVKYDYKAFIRENVTPQGNFASDGIFKKIGADSYSYGKDGYYVDLHFIFNCGKKIFVTYFIRICQDGALFIPGTMKPKKRESEFLIECVNEAIPKIMEVLQGLKKHEFNATHYELWPDLPECKYYILNPESSLCNITFPITE